MDVLRDQAEEANRLMDEDVRHNDEAIEFQRQAEDSARWTADDSHADHAWHDDYAPPPPFEPGGGMGFP